MSSSRRRALSTLRSLKQIEYYGCRRLFSSNSNASFSSSSSSSSSSSIPAFPTLREVPKTLTTASGRFSWPDEYDWISKKRHAREFEAHVDAENRASASFFSAPLVSSLAASLAAEARRLSLSSASSSSSSSSVPRHDESYEDSVPERIGDSFYFTRTGISDGTCSLLRRKRESKSDSGDIEVAVVVDVAEVASSQRAVSLGQLKLSPCGRAVAMTLDVGAGGEFWRLVVVEAGSGGRVVGSVDGVTSVEWGGGGGDAFSSSPPHHHRHRHILLLPPLFYTRGGAGTAVSSASSSSSSSTLHVAPWDASARKFRFDEKGDDDGDDSSLFFVERDPSRVLALGKSKDGALLTLASASAAGSAAYAMRLPRREGFGSSPSSSLSTSSSTSLSSPSSSSPSSSPSSPPSSSSSSSPFLSTKALTCVAPFEEGVEHYLEHCDSVPGGIVVMTTTAAAAEEGGGRKQRSGEFWLAAPLASSVAPSSSPLRRGGGPFPAPSEWPALLSAGANDDDDSIILTDVDVYRDKILCYGRCPSTGQPRLSLLRDLGKTRDDGDGSTRKLSPTLQRVELPFSSCSSPSSSSSLHSGYCVVRPGANADPDSETARLELSSPLAPPRAFDLDLSSGAWSSSSSLPSPSSSSSYLDSVASELEFVVERTEGRRVPVTVVRPRRKLEKGEEEEENSSPSSSDSSLPRPVLLTLYGAYGTPLDPEFDPVRLALAAKKDKKEAEREGIGGGWDLAFAHLRGGGELGKSWHSQGKGSQRHRVVEDAREVVEWLSRGGGSGGGGGGGVEGEGDGRRRPVALCAESAGALVAGALLAASDDDETSRLLSAVSLRVPFLDVLPGLSADEGDDDGEGEAEEDREQRRRQRTLLDHERGEFAPSELDDDEDAVASSLASVCPYHLLSRSESLPLGGGPPVFVTAAEHDARAPVAGAVKWVSRLRRLRGKRDDATSSSSSISFSSSSSSSSDPSSVVLLEVLRGCGHAEGLRRADDIERNAREAAFLVDAVERERRGRERMEKKKKVNE